MSDKLSVELSKRQTNRKEAEKVKENLKNLLEKGAEVSILDVRYVKLAEYENREEELNRLYSDLIDCPRAGAILTSREMDYIEDNDENYE